MAELSDLGFAIVGCGLVGTKRASALARIAGTSLRAVFDSYPARAEALVRAHPGARVAAGWAAILADPAIHAVIVATPHASLAPLARDAVRAGRHVLVEKPGALNSGQMRAVGDAARRAGVQVRIGYNHRFHPSLRKAREWVDSGRLGPLLMLRARYGHGGRVGYEKEWRADVALSGGGELIDQGVHLIDLAGWFLGEFDTVAGHATTSFWPMAVDDNAFLSLRTPAGQTAWLHASCTEWRNLFSFELYGRQGKLAIDGLGGSYGPEKLTCYTMRPEMGPPDIVSWEYVRADDSWEEELRAWVDDVRLGRTPSPGWAEGLRTLEIVEEIYRRSGYPLNTASIDAPPATPFPAP